MTVFRGYPGQGHIRLACRFRKLTLDKALYMYWPYFCSVKGTSMRWVGVPRIRIPPVRGDFGVGETRWTGFMTVKI